MSVGPYRDAVAPATCCAPSAPSPRHPDDRTLVAGVLPTLGA
jgi:hypothetical protein